MNEIDKMALELKKIKKGYVIFYETLPLILLVRISF